MKTLLPLLVVAVATLAGTPSARADKKVLFIAGNPSHGPGEHEHHAGCRLLAGKLGAVPGIRTEVHRGGWPADESALEGAAAIFIYCDGGNGHPAIRPERLAKIGSLMAKGVGFGTCHYAVEVPKGPAGDAWLAWTGGYFETHWSVNPHWEADFTVLPVHPITRGVKPFKIRDEWYYHMRFPAGLTHVTPILSAVPPLSTLERPDGPHSGNPAVRASVEKREAQHVMWCIDRPDGGRGFGFTGGHFHRNWGNDDFRKIVLNALVWIAKEEVPADGVSSSVSPEELQANLDPKRR